MFQSRSSFILATGFVLLTGLTVSRADDPTPEQIKYFEEKIRPLFVDHCHECHGPDKQESDLRLDSREAVLRGGASGPAVNRDAPERSLLLQVLRYDGDIEMPPDQKLEDQVITRLEKWIEMDLPWPKSDQPVEVPISMPERVKDHRVNHWAFQPIVRPQPTAIPNDSWSRGAIDQLVFSKLKDAGLTPSKQAERYVLVRRLYLGLLGIPPTEPEVREALADQRSDWYENLVDQLLASPRYGERWGRHWLDVARYADTRGYSFQRDRNYPHAYSYRDYVIESLNADKPYDRFVVEQLAADQVDLGKDLRPLRALGFLTVGRKFNNIHDDVDDKIDVVTRGLMGLTVSCARCHDHKYDAIPTSDYYSLYGVFVSSREGALPFVGMKSEVEAYQRERSKLDAAEKELADFLKQQADSIRDQARTHTASYFARVLSKNPKDVIERNLPFVKIGNDDTIPKITRAWRDYIRGQANARHPLWSPWYHLSRLPDDETFGAAAANLVAEWKKKQAKINLLLLAELTERPPSNRMEIARAYGKVFSDVYAAWKKNGSNDRGLSKLSQPQRQVGIALFTDRTPTDIKPANVPAYLATKQKSRLGALKQNVKTTREALPPKLDRAMVVTDIPKPVEPFVFLRGQASRRGPTVPRQFVEVVSPVEREPFEKGSGRLELAKLIAHPENPLTARVIANRVWMHHMGDSLVPTPSDFGTRCPPPVQQDVLDVMASELISRDWSLKSLHRLIVCSSTYRQASVYRADAAEADPDNELYWKANRQRLEFEPLRDSMLAVANELDLQVGGQSVEITKPPFHKRRAVYGYIDRQDLPNLLRAFDFASPDQSAAKRTTTTVPQQLLFLMNSDFVRDVAEQISKRIGEPEDPEAIVQSLYRKLFARAPTSQELSIGVKFLQSRAVQSEAVQQLAQILLLTNEFTFVD